MRHLLYLGVVSLLLTSCGCDFGWDSESWWEGSTLDTGEPGEEDVPVHPGCDPACDPDSCCIDGECTCCPDPCRGVTCDPCEVCDSDWGECVSACGEGECCGPDGCHPCVVDCSSVECGPCEWCDAGTGDCVSDCDEDEVCYREACCRPDCDGVDCGPDGCGGSCGTCDDVHFCSPRQLCEDLPCCPGCPGCLRRGWDCCDAVVVNELRLAGAPDASAGDPGCCCDYDDDGEFDNALAGLIANVGSMAELDLDAVNEVLAEQIVSGAVLALLELVCFEQSEPVDYASLHFYFGEDTDDDAGDNFSGDEAFTITAGSLDDNGEPLTQFEGVAVDEEGHLTAPFWMSQFGRLLVPFRLPDYGFDFNLLVDGVRLEADLSYDDEVGYSLANGTLCGYVTAEQILGALNEFAVANCDCLRLDGDLIVYSGDGDFACSTPSATPTCDPDTEMGEICGYFAQYCNTVLTLLPMFMDVDTDGDVSTGEGMSLGATFTAVPALIVEGVIE